ncbi:MAG: HAMP domain-containing protein [Cyanobacterium sp. T60_A2020_053]|nr:HAMP domain-containing protein [Cyanobacterium sp. T60_A2020_053]
MASESDYQQRYGQAQNAYLEGDLTLAQSITDDLIMDYPDDPTILLLKGHICLQREDFSQAKISYEEVLDLTDRSELVNLAQQGLAQIEEEQIYPAELDDPNFADEIEELDEDEVGDNWTNSINFDNLDWDAEELEEEEVEDPTLQQNNPLREDTLPRTSANESDSFSFEDEELEDEKTAASFDPPSRSFGLGVDSNDDDSDFNFHPKDLDLSFDQVDLKKRGIDDVPSDGDETGAPTFVVSSEEDSELSDLEKMLTNTGGDIFDDLDDDYGDYSSALEPLTSGGRTSPLPQTTGNNDGSFMGDDDDDFFFVPDELDDIPDITADELPVSSIFTKDQRSESYGDDDDSGFDADITGSFGFDSENLSLDIDDEEIGTAQISPQIASLPTSVIFAPEVEVPTGNLSKYYNLPLLSKQLLQGAVTGVVTFIAVMVFSTIFAGSTEENRGLSFGNKFLLGLLTGVSAGAMTTGAGYFQTRHIKRYTTELQNQFESIYQGNYDVKITIYSQDEFGSLASSFNQMAKMIKTTTAEARKRVEETEKAREDLQKQVIRLLDDVEGAARGDLMVKAEVTADVLGAVADSFNNTIFNLRKIVRQVKQAAVQVNKASTDSEVFARNQSSDALRMAEELAVTLNSVQMMTDSIQRVAENAREAEEVARSSSVTALKGGDAVERTVAGILQIRETVSETTRKVKRLAEASQQISTIVAVISNISSRTNLLALNASIQAARAGEAGRGFAIVADEVRQLADRSAKSLQEIEQIVLQIQTETGSVMTAMEEGIQQVRDVTDRSEQAKRALEDIIQVSNRIDALVRSITADTDEQRENSRGVAKVMQAVELTAQATSQESQRVAGSLQNLVGIARDLISSVERFKVGDDRS